MSLETEEMGKSFQELLEESLRILRPGDKVTGTVAAITATEIMVEIGCRYPASIFLPGLGDVPAVRVGEEIDAYVVRVSDHDCIVELSFNWPPQQRQRATKNITNRDTREICDIVREQVLTEVQNNLSQMKPDIVSSIVEEVVRKMDGRYASQIERLEKRISELEQHISDAQEASVRQKVTASSPRTAEKIDTSRLYRGVHFDG